MTKLSVNLNAVAYLRNRRDVGWPDLQAIARAVLDAGAHGLTVHPRPDERHIRRADVEPLAALCRERGVEFNVEGFPTADFLALVAEVRPDQVTLVPDDPAQATSDHGWNMELHGAMLRDVLATLKGRGARTSLFADPDPADPARAKALGADRVELYTGPYGGASGEGQGRELDRLAATAAAAQETGIGVNAGHDLTAGNLPPLVRAAPNIEEVSIGHALTADALMVGYPQAVRRYLAALQGG